MATTLKRKKLKYPNLMRIIKFGILNAMLGCGAICILSVPEEYSDNFVEKLFLNEAAGILLILCSGFLLKRWGEELNLNI